MSNVSEFGDLLVVALVLGQSLVWDITAVESTSVTCWSNAAFPEATVTSNREYCRPLLGLGKGH